MIEPLMCTVVVWFREKFAWTGFLRPTYFERIDIAKAKHIEKYRAQHDGSIKGIEDEDRLAQLREKFEEFKREVYEDEDDAFWLKKGGK